jgi:hypothetical protein
MLVEHRANRIVENYGTSKRDARLVVAVAEQLGKLIEIRDEMDDFDDGPPEPSPSPSTSAP